VLVAGHIDDWCKQHLGARVAAARFYHESIGCVAGLELDDGRAVVVKASRSTRDRAYLETCHEVQTHLARSGFPCPRPIQGPERLGEAWLTCEELLDRGECPDAHEPSMREAIATSLARMVALARPLSPRPALGASWGRDLPEGRLYPAPHSPLFDFEATRAGAEWIDELAARARRVPSAGAYVIGHFDWRAEHLRFDAAELVASYDWDSLHFEREPLLVGAIAHGFTANWSRSDRVQFPSLDEVRGFVADYEQARGGPFDSAERSALAAGCVYSLAYGARCAHAGSPNLELEGRDFRTPLRAYGNKLLDEGI
jgi:hypothetical protein